MDVGNFKIILQQHSVGTYEKYIGQSFSNLHRIQAQFITVIILLLRYNLNFN